MAPVLIANPDDVLLSPKGRPVVLSPLSTPHSQVSTAPHTPMLSLLPDTYAEFYGKLVRTTSGASTQVPEEDFLEEEELEHKESPSRALSFGLPRLQSELGRWAEAVVRAEDWMEDEWRKQQHTSSSSARKEYLVDNSELRADTVGLAFRCSKQVWDRDLQIAGPMWGETVAGFDQGDGWVKVGDHFLPMELDGLSVLTQRVEPLRDGPSLTAAGVALDLEFGAPIFFSHSKGAAGGCDLARRLKEEHRMHLAERRAQAAREAEARILAGTACSVDAAGVVRGLAPEEADCTTAADRLKSFHRRRRARHQHEAAAAAQGDALLCAGPDGKVFLFLTLEHTAEAAERLRRKRATLSRPEVIADEDASCNPWVVDVYGVIHL